MSTGDSVDDAPPAALPPAFAGGQGVGADAGAPADGQAEGHPGTPPGPAFEPVDTPESQAMDTPAPRPMLRPAPGPSWSGGWSPLPAQTAPQTIEPLPERDRRSWLLPALVALVVGALAGATAGVAASRSNSAGTAEVQVDPRAVPNAAPGSPAAVAAQLGPAVGTIIAGLSGSQSSLGTGFVISHDRSVSYLVTNNHVVAGQQSLHVVMPSGATFSAAVVGTDSADDLAVVSVPDTTLPVATFGDSRQLQVGQSVLAIGSPLGNQGSATLGIVSALHRTITAGDTGNTTQETLQDVLQTDASINPGNSGGPLADLAGRVVGVNVALAGSSNNIGFSIPSVLARRVAEALIAHHPVPHPYLGIQYLDDIDAVRANQPFQGPGVLISQVPAGGPAAKAGFHSGDILEKVGGITIENGQTLGGLIQGYGVGDTVSFTVRRDGHETTLSATLQERPAAQ